MRILGIDPGIAIVGFGLIEADRGRTRLLNYGAITTPAGHPKKWNWRKSRFLFCSDSPV